MSYWTIATIIEVIWVIVSALGLVLERRSPVATLAWIFVLAWMPAIGFVVYFFFGPRRLRRKKLRRLASKRRLREAAADVDEEADDPLRTQLSWLAVAAGESPALRARRVELFTEGQECYASMAQAIDAAQHHVHVEYYIWEPDTIGTRLRDQLARRAKEGIEVRFLVDGLGSYSLSDRWLEPLVSAGAEVAVFNPVTLMRLRPQRANFRTHRKIVVVDGDIGFTGGINVDDVHTAEVKKEKAWRDTHLRFEGSAVRALGRVFLEDWTFATERPPPTGARYLKRASSEGEHLVQVVASGPDLDTFAIHKMLFAAITTARRRVWLTTPYFVPDESMLTAIETAAMRKVDVRILCPSHGDSRLVDLAARSYFPDLLRVGVKIFEYQPRFIHAKTLVVDDDLAIVGTANCDNRSFRLNFEVVAAVYGPEIAARLGAAFEDDLVHAREVRPRALAREPLIQRFAEGLARLLSPIL